MKEKGVRRKHHYRATESTVQQNVIAIERYRDCPYGRS